MSKFKIKVSEGEQVIARARIDDLDDFDDLFSQIKMKYKGRK